MLTEQGQAATEKQQVGSDAAARRRLRRKFLAQLKSVEAQADASTIVQGMRAHSKNAAVQEEGCAALWSLASNDRVTTGAAGGIGAVLGAIKTHKDSASVQKAACWALSNLAINNDNAVTIAAAGGIEAIAAAMTVHEGSAAVQEQACWALDYLAGHASLRERIKTAGGVELAKRALSASDATELTKQLGEALLKKLA
jgi:hypothetical protein